MPLTIIKKDLLKVEYGIITHQVNMQGKMGAGLAKDIAEKWPIVKKAYIDSLVNVELGQGRLVPVATDLFVANLYSQNFYGRDKQNTDYAALSRTLHNLYHLSMERFEGRYPIYIPYGLGCGLGGATWETVVQIIMADCPTAIVCKK
jgi:hypothetical protein